MIALLLKDFYLIRKLGILVPLLALVFIVLGSLQSQVMYLVLSTLVMLMLSLSTMACDQSDGFDAYTLALPLSKKIIVFEKYLLGLSAMSISMILVSLLVIFNQKQTINLTVLFAIQSFFGFLFMAINYPLVFKFGFEKSRVWYILISMALAAFGGLLVQTNVLVTIHPNIFLFPLFGLLACFLSYCTSLKIVNFKEITEK